MIINFINVVMIIYTFSIDLCARVCGGSERKKGLWLLGDTLWIWDINRPNYKEIWFKLIIIIKYEYGIVVVNWLIDMKSGSE